MKTVGLIGGMSWESTVLYYKYINEGVKNALGGLHSAKIVMSSVDFAEVAELQSKGAWDKTADMMCDEAKRLQKAGADFIVLCTNTMHINAEEIEKAVSIPLLRITDAVAKLALNKNIKKAGLLGTAFTMEQDFYKGRMEKQGLEVITPNADDRKLVHDVIYNELCVGIISEKSRDKYIAIIEKMKSEGAEAVILGCTEIPLLIDQKDSSLPLLDTTKIHAESAVEMMLK